MFKIVNNKIYLTRGDTAEIDITLDGYELTNDDSLIMTVKKDTNTDEIAFQKNAVSGVLKINPVDTKKLEYGDYVYDIQLTTKGNDIYTVITPTLFKIEEEVTW